MSSPESPIEPHVRVGLTRDRIIAAAVALVDEAGPDALTMRAVAQRLSSGAMSLYRHVSGRDELLDLVLGAMAADLPETRLTGDWRADLAAIARDIRAGLVRRPHLTVLLTSRSGRGLAEVPALDRTLGVLRRAGFSRRDAVLANHALGTYVAGAALWEAVGLAGSTGEERAQRRREAVAAVARIPADQFPNLGWVGDDLVAGSLDERFEFGLAALIDGFDRRRTP
jgi:TetR/AcrR family transcriptional regulator, tetracycline repressor protein